MNSRFTQFTRKGLGEALSRPGVRLRGWRRLPLSSKAAVCFLAFVVLMALLAPLLAPHDPLDQQTPVDGTGHPSGGTGWARTVSAGTSSAG